MAMAFDALDLVYDRRELARACETSIGIGLLAAAGAAVTGMTDWSDVDPPARRAGLIHGRAEPEWRSALFATSLLFAKEENAGESGRIAGVLGYAVMSYAAHLGGKLVYEQKSSKALTRSSRPGFSRSSLPLSCLRQACWTANLPAPCTRARRYYWCVAEIVSLPWLRRAPHFSGPLSEGKLEGDTVVCPYHFSRFALEDGRVIDGPAVHPQPCLEVRTRNGQIEVRRAPAPS